MLAIPVVETHMPPYLNFPADHPCHFGNAAQPLLKDADLVLSIDCDLPWTPSLTKPRDDCRVFYLDIDPLKENTPIWYIPSERIMKANSFTALKQINHMLGQKTASIDQAKLSARRERLAKMRLNIEEQKKSAEAQQPEMTPAFVSACVREVIDDDTIILNEAISGSGAVYNHIPRNKPGTMFGSGGSSLGWACGAAFGIKLACPEKEVVALVGDGTYIFSIPTAVYWMSRRYNAPFMTVIFNNQGWNAPKFSTVGLHPDGYAVKENKFWVSFDPPARLDLVAEAAGGAFARTVSKPEDLISVLREGREAVKKGTSAVINVLLPPV
jgi:acetolactate synthase-1/2/3 large subunit